MFPNLEKKLKYGRKHGGLAVYIREYLLPGIDKVPTQGSETIVIKLKKNILDFLQTSLSFSLIVSLLTAATLLGLNLSLSQILSKK